MARHWHEKKMQYLPSIEKGKKEAIPPLASNTFVKQTSLLFIPRYKPTFFLFKRQYERNQKKRLNLLKNCVAPFLFFHAL